MGQRTKTPNESTVYPIDLSPRMRGGDSIIAVNSVTGSPSGLTIAATAFSGTVAQARISGGTSGTTYHVTFNVTTFFGDTIEGCGDLLVKAC